MVSFCELCGKQAENRKKIMVENTVFNVCIACSKRGKPIESAPSGNMRAIHGRNTRHHGKTKIHQLFIIITSNIKTKSIS